MGKISMWKRIVSLTIVLVLINGNASAVCATTVAKDASQETVDAIISENNVEPERTGGSLYGCEDVTESMECDVAWGGTCWMAFSAFNDTDQAIALTITSSNPAVADVRYPEEKNLVVEAGYSEFFAIECVGHAPGIAKFTVQMGNLTYTIPYFGYADTSSCLKSVKQIDYNTIEVAWDPVSYASGYRIMRAVYDGSYRGGETYQEVARVSGAATTTTTVDVADWTQTYSYKVFYYMESDGKEYYPYDYYSEKWVALKMAKLSTSITSVQAIGTDKIAITWAAAEDAKAYDLYRSTKKNSGYQKIYSGDASTLGYTDTVSAGITYYYKISVTYPEFVSEESVPVSKMLPKAEKTARKWISLASVQSVGEQYSWNWADTENVHYYTAGDKLYLVCPGSNCVRIYTLNSSFKVVKTKKIKIKYDIWGGFYAADDGNFYIAVGYRNPKESKKKTVIKVIKYDSKWKKGKTATIKGGAKNMFEGIYTPFDAGRCAMDMQGDVLYLHTGRTMFMHADGLRHQSNISFAINTKQMTAVTTEDTYSSHSFNQYAKFDGRDLYLLDHGDAYPRSICLSKVSEYGTESESTDEFDLFLLKGEIGENYTGCTVGGMEIGEKNVLVCGAAHPHYLKIKGVGGSEYGYAYNVYLLVADKESGQTNVIWLTQNNPKKSKVEIEGARMVKLDDNRFAVMYTTKKNGVATLNYVVVDGNGTKIYSKKYKNYTFTTGSQPIVYKGRVVWMTSENDYASRKYGNRMYAIPALTK